MHNLSHFVTLLPAMLLAYCAIIHGQWGTWRLHCPLNRNAKQAKATVISALCGKLPTANAQVNNGSTATKSAGDLMNARRSRFRGQLYSKHIYLQMHCTLHNGTWNWTLTRARAHACMHTMSCILRVIFLSALQQTWIDSLSLCRLDLKLHHVLCNKI